MKFRKRLFAILAIILLGIPAYLWINPASVKVSPDLGLLTLDGDRLQLAEMRGNPVLVTFWATTCHTCIREIPHLVKLYRDLAPHGLQLIAISMYYDPPDRVLAMRKARNIPYPVAMDIHGEAARAFGDVRVTPTSILIAPNGRIIYRKSGKLDLDRLRQEILAMLDEASTG